MAEWQIVFVFIASLVSTIVPSALILWRWNTSEKRKAMADTADLFQGIARDCAEDLEKSKQRVEELEEYIRQLHRVLANVGLTPPPFKRSK
jgi:hypothetical protein